MFAAQAERAARAAAEAEDRSLNGKLYEARRRSEALEEELQVSCKDLMTTYFIYRSHQPSLTQSNGGYFCNVHIALLIIYFLSKICSMV